MTSLTLCYLHVLLKCQMIVCPSSLYLCVLGTNFSQFHNNRLSRRELHRKEADLEAVLRVCLNPTLQPNDFIFIGNFEKILVKA